jgi:hypothetical protein
MELVNVVKLALATIQYWWRDIRGHWVWICQRVAKRLLPYSHWEQSTLCVWQYSNCRKPDRWMKLATLIWVASPVFRTKRLLSLIIFSRSPPLWHVLEEPQRGLWILKSPIKINWVGSCGNRSERLFSMIGWPGGMYILQMANEHEGRIIRAETVWSGVLRGTAVEWTHFWTRIATPPWAHKPSFISGLGVATKI